MEVYQTRDGIFIGVTEADPDPLNPGMWLIPGGCVVLPPPPFDMAAQRARWDGVRWQLERKEDR